MGTYLSTTCTSTTPGAADATIAERNAAAEGKARFEHLHSAASTADEDAQVEHLLTIWQSVRSYVQQFDNEADREERLRTLAMCLSSRNMPVRRASAHLLRAIICTLTRGLATGLLAESTAMIAALTAEPSPASAGSAATTAAAAVDATPSPAECEEIARRLCLHVQIASKIAHYLRSDEAPGIHSLLVMAMSKNVDEKLSALFALQAITIDFAGLMRLIRRRESELMALYAEGGAHIVRAEEEGGAKAAEEMEREAQKCTWYALASLTTLDVHRWIVRSDAVETMLLSSLDRSCAVRIAALGVLRHLLQPTLNERRVVWQTAARRLVAAKGYRTLLTQLLIGRERLRLAQRSKGQPPFSFVELQLLDAVPLLLSHTCDARLDVEVYSAHRRALASLVLTDRTPGKRTTSNESALMLLLWHALWEHDGAKIGAPLAAEYTRVVREMVALESGGGRAKGARQLLGGNDDARRNQLSVELATLAKQRRSCERLVQTLRRNCLTVVAYLSQQRSSFVYFRAPMPKLLPLLSASSAVLRNAKQHATSDGGATSSPGDDELALQAQPGDAIRALLTFVLRAFPNEDERTNERLTPRFSEDGDGSSTSSTSTRGATPLNRGSSAAPPLLRAEVVCKAMVTLAFLCDDGEGQMVAAMQSWIPYTASLILSPAILIECDAMERTQLFEALSIFARLCARNYSVPGAPFTSVLLRALRHPRRIAALSSSTKQQRQGGATRNGGGSESFKMKARRARLRAKIAHVASHSLAEVALRSDCQHVIAPHAPMLLDLLNKRTDDDATTLPRRVRRMIAVVLCSLAATASHEIREHVIAAFREAPVAGGRAGDDQHSYVGQRRLLLRLRELVGRSESRIEPNDGSGGAASGKVAAAGGAAVSSTSSPVWMQRQRRGHASISGLPQFAAFALAPRASQRELGWEAHLDGDFVPDDAAMMEMKRVQKWQGQLEKWAAVCSWSPSEVALALEKQLRRQFQRHKSELASHALSQRCVANEDTLQLAAQLEAANETSDADSVKHAVLVHGVTGRVLLRLPDQPATFERCLGVAPTGNYSGMQLMRYLRDLAIPVSALDGLRFALACSALVASAERTPRSRSSVETLHVLAWGATSSRLLTIGEQREAARALARFVTAPSGLNLWLQFRPGAPVTRDSSGCCTLKLAGEQTFDELGSSSFFAGAINELSAIDASDGVETWGALLSTKTVMRVDPRSDRAPLSERWCVSAWVRWVSPPHDGNGQSSSSTSTSSKTNTSGVGGSGDTGRFESKRAHTTTAYEPLISPSGYHALITTTKGDCIIAARRVERASSTGSVGSSSAIDWELGVWEADAGGIDVDVTSKHDESSEGVGEGRWHGSGFFLGVCFHGGWVRLEARGAFDIESPMLQETLFFVDGLRVGDVRVEYCPRGRIALVGNDESCLRPWGAAMADVRFYPLSRETMRGKSGGRRGGSGDQFGSPRPRSEGGGVWMDSEEHGGYSLSTKLHYELWTPLWSPEGEETMAAMQQQRGAITDADMKKILGALDAAEDEVKRYLIEAATQLLLLPRHRRTAIAAGSHDHFVALSRHPSKSIRDAVLKGMANMY